MGRHCFWFILLVLLNGASRAETQLYLKTRALERAQQKGELQAGFPKRQAAGRSHIVVQFSTRPQESDVLELRYRGADILGYLPKDGFILSADDATPLEGLNLLRAGWFHPADKISPLAAEPPRAAYIVEFHRDIEAAGARALVRELALETREHPDLLPHHLLVEGPPERVLELAEWDEVAYIYPASEDLVDGVRVEACPGALTEYGPVGQYVARVGDGWDGPGRGAAELGYFLGALTQRLPRERAQTEILRAFAEWGRYARITFQPAREAKAPRTVSVLFGSRDHGDAYPFDGPGHVLAHTFYPAPPNPEPIAGDMHFDGDEAWGESLDVFSVALHEAGHALGLGHSDRPGTVMYPYYRRVTGLAEEDIAAIRELYAAAGEKPAEPKPADPPTPAPPPEPKPNPQPPAPAPAPVLTITAPGPGPSYSSSRASIQLAGTAEHADGIARVTWSNARGGAGAAAGTRAWLAGPVPLEPGANLLTVTAFTPGGRSAARTLTVTYSTGSDTVPPAVTILSPAGTSVLTYDTAVTLRGTASDNVGVAEVTWADSTGASGTAQGTNFWTTPAIPLREGANTLTVRARDAAGNTGWRTIAITRKRR